MMNVAAQVGCFTFIIIMASFLVGLWLDRAFQIKGLFTILLVLASVPLTWVFIFWVVNKAKKQMLDLYPVKPRGIPTQSAEEDNLDNL